MPRSAKLKGLNLRYPIAWRDFLLRNTMSTGKLRNMMFKISHFWDEKRPTKKSEDRIPTMLLPASPQPAIPRPALKDFWNNRRQETVPFVLKVHPSSPSRLFVHGLLWRTSETIGVGSYAIRFKSPSQRPVTDVRPRPAPTARSDGLLKQSAWEALPFVSKVHPSGPPRTSVHGPPPRPALKGFWNNRREELVPFVSKVHPSGPSRTSVHGPPPRPALTDFWNNRRKEAVPFVSKVHPSGPSRTAVHGPPPTARSDRLLKQSAWGTRAVCFKSPSQRPVTDGRPRPAPHGPLWRTSETISVRNSCRLFQKSIPAARHGRPSTAHPHGPLWLTSETIGVRNSCRLFQKSIPAARHGRPSTARPHGPLWRTSETIGVRNSCRLFQKSIPAARHGRPSTARPHGPLWLTSATIGARNPCHLFQKSIPAARHGQPSTVRSHGQLWQTFETFGVRNPPYHFFFQKPIAAARQGRPSPTRSHSPLWLTKWKQSLLKTVVSPRVLNQK